MPHLSHFDHAVIAFYLLFMLAMGWVFKCFITNTSDYFRAGGQMLWWIVGASAFMQNFSAVSFTGFAGKAYEDGPVVLVIFFANAVGYFFNVIYFAPVFRQMRCVTAMDAVRKRFGKANEQFFTWMQIPLGMLYAAIWLYGLAVFLKAAFGMEMWQTIVISGVVVIFIAVLGGSWSTTASEFVQMLLLMPVTLVAAVFALSKVGGVHTFIERAPRRFWHWGEVANSKMIALWVIAMLIKQWAVINNMTDASRYLNVKDSRQARMAAMFGTILFIIGPIIWFLPPMIARVLYPDLRATFPNMPNPRETAYFAMAVTTMPVGMMGLLLSGIFATTLGQMDTGLNRNAGYFIKNFYQVILHPRASERELLFASKIATITFGLLIILATLWFASMKDLTIFDLMVNFGSWVALPISIPLIWGMFIRRAPNWAGWTCVLITLLTSYLTQKYLTAHWLGHFAGLTLNKREASDWSQAAGVLINVIVGSGWFLLTPLLSRPRPVLRHRSPDSPSIIGERVQLDYETRERPVSDAERVDRFFEEMRTPVDFAKEEGAGSDNLQAKIMGRLCLTYGGFITLLALIPNPLTGRLVFVFCGMVMFGIGWILHRASRRQSN